MLSSNDKISEELNITPEYREEVNRSDSGQIEISGKTYKPNEADDDYNEVRRNLKVVIEQSNSAIQGILELAEDSQQPRAYEVVAQLIGQTLEANTRLIDLHRRMRDIKKEDGPLKATNVTNNSIFVGSTAELQKMIKAQQKQIIDVSPIQESK
jgi:hypothetical protein